MAYERKRRRISRQLRRRGACNFNRHSTRFNLPCSDLIVSRFSGLVSGSCGSRGSWIVGWKHFQLFLLAPGSPHRRARDLKSSRFLCMLGKWIVASPIRREVQLRES